EQLSYKLKEVCHQLYSWAGMHTPEFYEVEEHQHLKDKVLPKLGKSPRQIWIEFGTSVGRVVYPETLVEYLWHNVSCDVMIVSDMRFVNEANRIRHYGGYVIKLINNRIPHTSDVADDNLLDYPHWSIEIYNNGTLKELHQNIVDFADEHIIPRL